MSKAEYPVWLAVMPDQRAAARAAAGKLPDGRNAIDWSKEETLWYARPGADLNRLKAWLPDRTIRSSGGGDPQEEFLDALTRAGLVLDGLPVMDGRRHRVPVLEGKKGNRDGVYRGFLDGVKPGGWYINYHRADNDKDITRWKGSGRTGEADPVARVHIRAVMRQSRDDTAREQAALYARQTASARALYERLPAADHEHSYLIRKGVTVAPDIRQTRNGALVIPFYDADGGFRTLQYIPPDGEKYLYKDAPKSGHFRVEGRELRNGEPILYAEGYATARSLHMVTGYPVVMTIDAGNMETVALVLKERYPDSPHLFMADVDHAKEKNKGVLSAERAAVATDGRVLLPDLTTAEIERGFTDFNDLHQSRGIGHLRNTLLPDIARALEDLNYKETLMVASDDAQAAPDNAQAPTPDTVTTPSEPSPPFADEQASPETVRSRSGTAKDKSADILALREQGLKPAQIAEQLGIGQTSVYRILRMQKTDEPQTLTTEPVAGLAVSTAGAEEPVTSGERVSAGSETVNGSEDKTVRESVLSDSGMSQVDVAGELNTGMGETDHLLQQGRDESPTEPVTGPASDPDVEPENASALQENTASDLTSSSPLSADFGDENGILTGPRRIAPSDDADDAPQTHRRIDADKLLSRVTHETQPDGKSVLYKLDGEPAFTDRGNRLVMAEGASAHEEKVLAALLTAAQHYHGRIELTGSDAFRAFAISVIVANKLDVSMKNASQQVALDDARRAAGQPVTPADTVRGEPKAPGADTVPVTPDAPTPSPDSTAPRTDYVTPSPKTEVPQVPARPDIPPAVHTPAEKAREPVTGKVTACGSAPFRFDPDESASTFITLRNREGTQTFWGRELAGLLRETRLKEGQMVTLQWMGEKPVTINKPVKSSGGDFTGHYEKVEVKRNQWSLTPVRGPRVQTGGDELVKLSAFDVNRYTQIQQTVVKRLGIDMDAPPKPADGLYWLRPDGQGSATAGDALSAERPAYNERAGTQVMSAWAADGTPDLFLVQGDGHYLQGVVRQNGEYQHVLVSLPDSKEAPPMVVNLLTPDGAVPTGNGNGINRSNGQPVPREHVVIRLTGDDRPRIAKLDAPADLPPALHARLGYDERYRAEAAYSKDRPAAAPQAVPVTPPRPA